MENILLNLTPEQFNLLYISLTSKIDYPDKYRDLAKDKTKLVTELWRQNTKQTIEPILLEVPDTIRITHETDAIGVRLYVSHLKTGKTEKIEIDFQTP